MFWVKSLWIPWMMLPPVQPLAQGWSPPCLPPPPPPPMDYPYPQTAQTCQCGEQGCSPALCQELNTMNVKGELLLHADHGALNPMSCWAHTLCVVQG